MNKKYRFWEVVDWSKSVWMKLCVQAVSKRLLCDNIWWRKDVGCAWCVENIWLIWEISCLLFFNDKHFITSAWGYTHLAQQGFGSYMFRALHVNLVLFISSGLIVMHFDVLSLQLIVCISYIVYCCFFRV